MIKTLFIPPALWIGILVCKTQNNKNCYLVNCHKSILLWWKWEHFAVKSLDKRFLFWMWPSVVTVHDGTAVKCYSYRATHRPQGVLSELHMTTSSVGAQNGLLPHQSSLNFVWLLSARSSFAPPVKLKFCVVAINKTKFCSTSQVKILCGCYQQQQAQNASPGFNRYLTWVTDRLNVLVKNASCKLFSQRLLEWE